MSNDYGKIRKKSNIRELASLDKQKLIEHIPLQKKREISRVNRVSIELPTDERNKKSNETRENDTETDDDESKHKAKQIKRSSKNKLDQKNKPKKESEKPENKIQNSKKEAKKLVQKKRPGKQKKQNFDLTKQESEVISKKKLFNIKKNTILSKKTKKSKRISISIPDGSVIQKPKRFNLVEENSSPEQDFGIYSRNQTMTHLKRISGKIILGNGDENLKAANPGLEEVGVQSGKSNHHRMKDIKEEEGDCSYSEKGKFDILK